MMVCHCPHRGHPWLRICCLQGGLCSVRIALAFLGQPRLTLPASSSCPPSPGFPSIAPDRLESGFMAGSSASCPRPHVSPAMTLPPALPGTRHPLYPSPRGVLHRSSFPHASLLPFLCPQPWHHQATCCPNQKTIVHFLLLLSAPISTFSVSSAK